MKRPVQIYLGEHERLNLIITASELQVAELIVDILKLFFAITKSMSSEVASVSVVIHSILTLQKYVQRREDPEGEIAVTKQMVLSAVEKRFFNENDNRLNILRDLRYILPTILDPRFKQAFPSDAFENAKFALINGGLIIWEHG